MAKVHPKKGSNQLHYSGMERTVWTVWKKSGMGLQGTDGFMVYDGVGRLVSRVENYSRKTLFSDKEVVLMDGAGRPLLFLRPHQMWNMHCQWDGFKGEGEHRVQTFCLRKRSMFDSSDDAEVYLYGPTGRLSQEPEFRVEGSFWKRSCKITCRGQRVAEIQRKMARPSVELSTDVFSLTVKSGADCELFMGIVVIMDRICMRPYTTIVCSTHC